MRAAKQGKTSQDFRAARLTPGLFWARSLGAERPSAAGLAEALRHIAPDPGETYRVRDVRLRRGDVSIYFNEGVLSFATAVQGRTVAAVFTTMGVEAGDAEILVMPPQSAERASLASFTKLPNLDEHFATAVLFFSDTTREEILKQLLDAGLEKVPGIAFELAPTVNGVLQFAGSKISTQTIESLLEDRPSGKGFFFSLILGKDLGLFDFLYQPELPEPVTVGKSVGDKNGAGSFQVWTAYRPRSAPLYVTPPPRIGDYRIDATIKNDLSLDSTARFEYLASPDRGRVIRLSMTRRLKVESAKVDGHPVEVFQNYSPDLPGVETDSDFLLIAPEPFTPGRRYPVEVKYTGSVIRRISESSYFVSERNVWYPHTEPMLTMFDLTLRCPERFGLVSTGEPVSETIEGGIRTVRRRTQVPEQLAGFNLGEYKSLTLEHAPYRIECYADKGVSEEAQRARMLAAKEGRNSQDLRAACLTPRPFCASSSEEMNGIPQACEGILDRYSRSWGNLPIHTVAITPIAGYFGQGFPGLIYLSSTAYLPEKDRPSEVRNQRNDTFFSQLLLPHEIAHQWWGNVVTSANYRSDWLMESMANYSALQLVEEKEGTPAFKQLLEQFRKDLLASVDGKSVESFGPVDFGVRLLEAHGENIWHVIVYEKGTWILHMLRERMGEEGFHRMQVELLRQYAGKPITNEEFRKAASEFIPAGQPDKHLDTFFETWVYGTGVPVFRLNRSESSLQVSNVDDAFTADLPLRCKSKKGESARWIRVVSGSNPMPEAANGDSCRLPSASDYLYIE